MRFVRPLALGIAFLLLGASTRAEDDTMPASPARR